MIPGGKLLGTALVSTQKALSLVQEQVAGQRGHLRAPEPPSRARSRQRRARHPRPGSAITGLPLTDGELRWQAAEEGEEEGGEIRRWPDQKLALTVVVVVGRGGGAQLTPRAGL